MEIRSLFIFAAKAIVTFILTAFIFNGIAVDRPDLSNLFIFIGFTTFIGLNLLSLNRKERGLVDSAEYLIWQSISLLLVTVVYAYSVGKPFEYFEYESLQYAFKVLNWLVLASAGLLIFAITWNLINIMYFFRKNHY